MINVSLYYWVNILCQLKYKLFQSEYNIQVLEEYPLILQTEDHIHICCQENCIVSLEYADNWQFQEGDVNSKIGHQNHIWLRIAAVEFNGWFNLNPVIFQTHGILVDS